MRLDSLRASRLKGCITLKVVVSDLGLMYAAWIELFRGMDLAVILGCVLLM